MKPIILFDLYDTIVNDYSVDFNRGLFYLYQEYFQHACTYEELCTYAKSLLPKYEARKLDNSEVCFLKEELTEFFHIFGVTLPKDLYAVEYEFMNQMQKVKVLDSVKSALNQLAEKNITMYIVSNSIFTSRSTKKFLHDLEVDSYFHEVYSSADYGIRKPDSRFFHSVIEDIKTKETVFDKEQFVYVGNDYNTDMIGSTEAGLKAVWYNVNHLENIKHLNIKEIDDFKQLITVLAL